MQLMSFFIWNKNVSFMIYSDFCGLVKFTDFKISDVIISIPINGRYTSAYFLWILNPIRMKFGQILVCCKTNISNMFLAQCWRLETSPRPIFNCALCNFSKKHSNVDIICYWVIRVGCQIENALELSPRPPNCLKDP